MQPDAAEFVDLDRYPIDRPGPELDALLAHTRAAIDADGCAVLEGFVRADRLAELVAECDRTAEFGHRNFTRTNPYFTADRDDLPPTHPLRRFYDRSNAFVPGDHFGDDSILRAIYRWPAFAPFVQAALGEERFFPYADPLADVIVNLAEEGNGFPWHFDTNNYTVTLAIQNADAGGDFEYSPHLRTPTDENYEGVERVLDGDQSLIRTITLRPGDLQIFKGRYSLHRVTPLAGPRLRYVAIFSFVEEPGMVTSPERVRQLYGRVLPIHLERAGLRADSLVD
ncbi:MAG: HalD/BesD family halogenase [Ilumatobacteraceae bacterium]